MLTLEVIVQGNKIQAQFLGNDMHSGSAGKCRIHVHHTGIESITGVSSHTMLWLQRIITLIPVAEAYQVAMRQLTALWNTRRTRGIKEDEEIGRFKRFLGQAKRQSRALDYARNDSAVISTKRSEWRDLKVFRQDDFALILIHDRAQLLISDEQLRVSILHHEVQALLRIGGIEGLISTTSFQYTE